jgi:hypothetical protein
VPALIQMMSAQPVQDSLTQQAKKANYVELLEDALTWSGMDADEFIVDMTPADLQRAQQMNPAAVKAAGDAQKQNLDNQGKLQQIEAQGTADAGNKVVEHILDESKAENQLPPQLQQLMGQDATPQPQVQPGQAAPVPKIPQPAPQPLPPAPAPKVSKVPNTGHFQGANEGNK